MFGLIYITFFLTSLFIYFITYRIQSNPYPFKTCLPKTCLPKNLPAIPVLSV